MNIKNTNLYRNIEHINDKVLNGIKVEYIFNTDFLLFNYIITFIFTCIIIPIILLIRNLIFVLLSPIAIPLFLFFDFYNIYYEIKKEIYRRKEEKRRLKLLKNIPNLILEYGNNLEKRTLGTYKFENYKHKKNIKLEDFMFDYFFKLNSSQHTLDWRGLIQCEENKRRSLSDIYLICKTYYPDCNILQILQILIALYYTRKICFQKCNQIGKYVFFPRYVSSYVNDREYVDFIENHAFTMEDVINQIKQQ